MSQFFVSSGQSIGASASECCRHRDRKCGGARPGVCLCVGGNHKEVSIARVTDEPGKWVPSGYLECGLI